MVRYISATETATLVRKSLKETFPNVKFSVRTSKYSGGASVDVRYDDARLAKREVRALVKTYEGATFDGMTDSKYYHTSELNGESVRFGADFIFVTNEGDWR